MSRDILAERHCGYCDREFSKPFLLQRHLLRMHSDAYGAEAVRLGRELRRSKIKEASR